MLALIVCLVSGCSQDNTKPAPTRAPEVTEAPATEVVTAAPAAETEAPAEETEAPAEETEAPAEETEAPAAETEAPAEETEAPAEVTEAPTEVLVTAEPEAPAAETEAPAEEAAAEPTAEPPVLLATVNGEEIWSNNSGLTAAYDNYIQTASSYGMDTTSEEVLSLLRGYSMQYAIQYSLIFQKAKELGLDTVTDEQKASLEAEVRTAWADVVDSYATQVGGLTETSTEDEKAAARADALAFIQTTYGYDEERFVTESMATGTENLIVDNVKKYALGGKTVTDEDVQKYFDDLVKEDQEAYENDVSMFEFYTQYYGQSSYYTPEGYRGIIHILLPVDEQLMTTWSDLNARFEEQKYKAEQEATGATPSDIEDITATDTPDPAAEPTPTPEPVTEEMVQAAKQAIMDSVPPSRPPTT